MKRESTEGNRQKFLQVFTKFSALRTKSCIFCMIFILISSLIFEEVSDGKTFICTLLFMGCNLIAAQTRKKARYGFVF